MGSRSWLVRIREGLLVTVTIVLVSAGGDLSSGLCICDLVVGPHSVWFQKLVLTSGERNHVREFLKSESESRSVVSDSLRPMDCIVHGILQARILQWVAFPFSRGSSQPRNRTQVS